MDSKKRESMEDYLLDQKEISAKDEVKLKTHSEHHTKKHMLVVSVQAGGRPGVGEPGVLRLC